MNIAPQIEQLAASKQHVNFCKVDVDRATDVMRAYPVKCMPTFKFFKGGSVVESFEGADINSVMRIVSNNEVLPPPPIPSDEVLNNMKPKELLALMRQLHISAVGLFEKPELIEQIKKFR
ncbi:thioredoxin 1 [Strigomonas culicis]|uniref:Thioredoxin 1 n=1 Tax=Strigomonas culicis TaxID=28005 RepID=S9UYQ1_9TRYP|nr:thioredoxin 1 [Strigomonas culicis]|eukprot:EPY15645.1 thioredoxin 1 [Strigomonas culicis]